MYNNLFKNTVSVTVGSRYKIKAIGRHITFKESELHSTHIAAESLQLLLHISEVLDLNLDLEESFSSPPDKFRGIILN